MGICWPTEPYALVCMVENVYPEETRRYEIQRFGECQYGNLVKTMLEVALCARFFMPPILRAKCFPLGVLLNCELKKGSSYTWQSIWAGIRTFNRWHIWRVWDGNKTDIWNDCWIPSSRTKKVINDKDRKYSNYKGCWPNWSWNPCIGWSTG